MNIASFHECVERVLGVAHELWAHSENFRIVPFRLACQISVLYSILGVTMNEGNLFYTKQNQFCVPPHCIRVWWKQRKARDRQLIL